MKEKFVNASAVIDMANEEATAAFYYPQNSQEQRKQDEQAYRDKWEFVKQLMVQMTPAKVVPVDAIHKACSDLFDEYRSKGIEIFSGGDIVEQEIAWIEKRLIEEVSE